VFPQAKSAPPSLSSFQSTITASFGHNAKVDRIRYASRLSPYESTFPLRRMPLSQVSFADAGSDLGESRMNSSVIRLLSVSVAFLVLLVAIFYLVITSGWGDIGASSFGQVAISLPSGRVFYARREARGFNYDVLAVSPDPHPCAHANPESDFILRYDGTPLYLEVKDNAVTILRYGGIEAPRSQFGMNGVTVNQLTFEEFQQLKKSYQEKHIRRLSIPLGGTRGDCR
jgi:hypothetical protein